MRKPRWKRENARDAQNLSAKSARETRETTYNRELGKFRAFNLPENRAKDFSGTAEENNNTDDVAL